MEFPFRMIIIHKICRGCGKNLIMTDYYKHKQMADGHLNMCKTCVKSRISNERAANLDKHRLRDKIRNSNRWDYMSKQSQKTRQMNPEKYKARAAVSNALRDGRLERGPCEVCGALKVQGHHDDYSKPLEVRWLCKKHHDEYHAQET